MTDVDTFKSIVLDQRLYDYMLRQAEPADAVQRKLIERTHALGTSAEMQIPHEQGVLLTMLVKLIGARRIVEVCTAAAPMATNTSALSIWVS